MGALSTAIGILVVIGLIILIASLFNKVPQWIAILFLYVIELLRILPTGG